jgi:hypothetical protein
VNRADRATWRAARTLADLGELTARWLEGEIRSQPGYADPAPGEDWGPDPETRALVPVLAAANRAGFVTSGSQPGVSDLGYDGAWWSQRAAVEGFASDVTLARLRAVALAASLIVIAHRPRRWRTTRCDAVCVTRRAGRDVTGFGVCLSRRHLRDSWVGYGVCHPNAVAALCQAWQVTLVDPLWGRDSVLWPVLRAFAGGDPR